MEEEEEEEEEEGEIGSLFINKAYITRSFCFRSEFALDLKLSPASSTDWDLTGQVLWPAADVLAYFLISNASLFRSRRILELGAGVGLCGILASKYLAPAHVCVTDNHPVVVELLRMNVDEMANRSANLSAATIEWSDTHPEAEKHTYDVIIGSDIVHWTNSIDPLCRTLDHYLGVGETNAAVYIAITDRASNTTHLFLDTLSRHHFSHRCIDLKTFMADAEVAALTQTTMMLEIKRKF